MRIDEFITQVGFLSRSLRKSLAAFTENIAEISFDSESGFPYELQVPDSSGSIRSIVTRLEVIVAHSETAAEFKHDDLVLQATTPLTDFQTHLLKLQGLVDRAIEQTAPFVDKSITVTTVEDGIALVTSEGNRIELRPLFSSIDAVVDAAFLAMNRIPIFADKKVAIASNIAAELGAARERYDSAYQELKNTRSVVKRFATEASGALEEIENSRPRIEALGSEIDGIVSSARSYNEHTPELEQIRERFSSLEADIEAFGPDFNKFRELLKDSEERFEEYVQEISDAREFVDKFLSDNESLIEKSKEALHWSTAAGLSASFATSQKGLNWPIRWALLQFYVAILFLAGSVLVATNSMPLVSDFVDLPKFPADLEANSLAYLARVFSVATLKLLILAPSLFFLNFSLKNLNTLNRLRHEYSFKRTLSIAVPGFKEEAPANQDMIVAAAFGELMSNPSEAAHKTGRSTGTPSTSNLRLPLIERLLRITDPASSSKPGE